MQFSKRTALGAAAIATVAFAVPTLASPHSPQSGPGSTACNEGTVTWTPNNLWPPNHQWVPIHISYQEDDGSSPDNDTTTVTVGPVTEADGGNAAQDATLPSVNGSGDPHNSDSQPDTDPSNAPTMGSDTTPATTTWDLRAERSGTDGHGSGRVYDLTVTCSDMGTEMSSESVHIQVTVPHDQGVVKP